MSVLFQACRGVTVLSVVIHLKVGDEGFEDCPREEGTIDGWGYVNGTMRHASKFTTAWESKLSQYIRIQHDRTKLGPGFYGTIQVSFKAKQATASLDAGVNTVSSSTSGTSATNESGVDYNIKIDDVVSILNNAHPTLANDFDKAYAAWKATWFAGSMRFSQWYVVSIVHLLWLLILLTGQPIERLGKSGTIWSRLPPRFYLKL